MKRDHVLVLVAGLLLGFLAGYFLQEVMVARQPPRLAAGPGQGAVPGANPGAPGANPGAQAAGFEDVQRLRERVAANPDDATAVLQLANLNFDIRNWDRAAELYRQYLGLRPESPDVISDLGICYRELRQFDAALEQFDRAQEVAPDHWQSRFNEAVVQAFDLEDYAAAEAVIEELRGLQPGNAEVERLAAEVAKRRDAA